MPLISFFVRRALTGAFARTLTRFLERRLKLSPGIASIAFLVITEVLARATEKSVSRKGAGFGRKG